MPLERKILCVTAEASGDRILAKLLPPLRSEGFTLRGSCGPFGRMAGMSPDIDTETLSAAGLVEALGSIPAHVGAYRHLRRLLNQVDAVLIIDAAELGLRL